MGVAQEKETSSETDDKTWHNLVARWRTAYGHAYASQARLIDSINTKFLGDEVGTIKTHIQIAEEMWAIESRRREELNQFIRRRYR